MNLQKLFPFLGEDISKNYSNTFQYSIDTGYIQVIYKEQIIFQVLTHIEQNINMFYHILIR